VIVVRAAAPREFAAVGELTVAAYRTLQIDHLWGGYDDAILDTATRAKETEVLVAVDGGEVVGSVTYVTDHTSSWSEWTEPGEAQFRLLAVAPVARGRGAGEALVRACMERAAAAGQTLLIHTTPWMASARRMYEGMGFVRRPDRDVPYAVWNSPPVGDLPPAWVDQPFLAYAWPE
jgi:ribosomal protein S18 acetylase RimI-like enzyme